MSTTLHHHKNHNGNLGYSWWNNNEIIDIPFKRYSSSHIQKSHGDDVIAETQQNKALDIACLSVQLPPTSCPGGRDVKPPSRFMRPSATISFSDVVLVISRYSTSSRPFGEHTQSTKLLLLVLESRDPPIKDGYVIIFRYLVEGKKVYGIYNPCLFNSKRLLLLPHPILQHK